MLGNFYLSFQKALQILVNLSPIFIAFCLVEYISSTKEDGR